MSNRKRKRLERKGDCGKYYIITRKLHRDGSQKITINRNRCKRLNCPYCLKQAKDRLHKEIVKSEFNYFFTITINNNEYKYLSDAYAALKAAKTKMIRRLLFKKNEWFMIFEFEDSNVHLHGVMRTSEDISHEAFVRTVSKYGIDGYVLNGEQK